MRVDEITFNTYEISAGDWHNKTLADREELISDLICKYYNSHVDSGLIIKVVKGLSFFEIKCFLNELSDIHHVLFDCTWIGGLIKDDKTINNAFESRHRVTTAFHVFMDQGFDILWKESSIVAKRDRTNNPIPEKYGEW